jgi:hypothetical protein
MTVQLEVAAETARLLQSNAALHQLSLDEYLRSLAELSSLAPPVALSLEEFERDMDQLAAAGETLPILPSDFARYAGIVPLTPQQI